MILCMCSPYEGCKQKDSCYRYRMIPNEYQCVAYMYDPHPSDPSIKCVNFVSIEGRKINAPKEMK